LAAGIDWVSRGKVNPIQDQGACGSCWAFSSIAAMESSHAILTNKLLKLSEQQLVDCSGKYGNEGCNGGMEIDAFRYAKSNPIQLESSYPYTGRDGRCKAGSVVVSVKSIA